MFLDKCYPEMNKTVKCFNSLKWIKQPEIFGTSTIPMFWNHHLDISENQHFPSTPHHKSLLCFHILELVDILIHVKLSLTSIVVHEANLSENFPFLPPLIVHTTNGPHATNKTICIVPIQTKVVVEVESIA